MSRSKNSKPQKKISLSFSQFFLALTFLVAFPIISYQLGYLAGSVEYLKEQTASLGESVEKLDRFTGLAEENIALKAALQKSDEQCRRAEEALIKAAMSLGFFDNLARVWQERNAAREIIIQKLLKKAPPRPTNIY